MALNNLSGFTCASVVSNGERSRVVTNLLESAIGQALTPLALYTNQEKEEKSSYRTKPKTESQHQGSNGYDFKSLLIRALSLDLGSVDLSFTASQDSISLINAECREYYRNLAPLPL